MPEPHEPPPVFTLIEGGEVYAPEPLGVQTVLLANERIVKVGAVDGHKLAALDLPVLTLDARGCVVTPGLIDPHEHLIGAGGEEGFATRTPEVPLRQLVSAGITTVVGLLGTDTTTRSLAGLLGRVRQLETEGLTAYMYTGGFRLPTPTLTTSVMDDLIWIDKVIGVGELAIADERAAAPTVLDLAKLVSDALLGGLVGGKAGLVHFHTGPGKSRLRLLHTLLDEHDLPAGHLYPAHCNRSEALLDDAIALARRGAWVDIDTTEAGLARWLRYYWEHGGPVDRLTVSSDAHAIGSTLRLYDEFRACVRDEGLALEQVLPYFTQNTAQVLQLPAKGGIQPGRDGDLLILDKTTLDLVHVVARGRHLLRDGQVIVTEPYETETSE